MDATIPAIITLFMFGLCTALLVAVSIDEARHEKKAKGKRTLRDAA